MCVSVCVSVCVCVCVCVCVIKHVNMYSLSKINKNSDLIKSEMLDLSVVFFSDFRFQLPPPALPLYYPVPLMVP